MEPSLQSLDQIRASALDMAVRFGPKVVVAILILIAGHLLGRWVGGAFGRLLLRLHLEAPVRSLLVRIVHLCVLVLFAIMALQNLGVELLPLIAGLSVAGAGVALAMQGLLGNLVAGLSIIFTRPFHVGDYISVAAGEGEVLDIRLFSTTLGHTDLSRVVIPNRKIVGEILHNHGQIRRLELTVGISFRADVDAALAAIANVLAINPRILKDPVPLLGITQLSESGVTIGVCPWVKVPDYEAAIREVNKAILAALVGQGIALAMSRYEVRMLEAVPDPV
ncbi:mechanosensitive ion channel family protein [Azonexus sp.]|jgi:small conductance mechanosensitive channel|uniref:mechanosensitive ion channel family protein n=1 Tax=Azonexus sp. TaxID=1872668 RepID=UPI00282ACBA8|nr:mechanosensitive ion channel family protein [Azonexus sp.]MDR1995525.1 mechanosensitive ion channel family protein [Azonexus sp.]